MKRAFSPLDVQPIRPMGWGVHRRRPQDDVPLEFRGSSDHGTVLKWAVDAASPITPADQANIRLLGSRCGALHIAAHSGFRQPFPDFFAWFFKGAVCLRQGPSEFAGELSCNT
jgi:hypothetical protein